MRSRRPASTGTGGGVGSPSRWLLRGPCRAWRTAACRGCSLVGRRREGREALAGGRRAGMRGAHMGRGGWGSKMLEGLGVCAVDNPGTAARSGPGPSTPAPARAAGSSSSAAGRAGSRWTWPAPASGSMGWIRPARWSAQPVPTPSRPGRRPLPRRDPNWALGAGPGRLPRAHRPRTGGVARHDVGRGGPRRHRVFPGAWGRAGPCSRGGPGPRRRRRCAAAAVGRPGAEDLGGTRRGAGASGPGSPPCAPRPSWTGCC